MTSPAAIAGLPNIENKASQEPPDSRIHSLPHNPLQQLQRLRPLDLVLHLDCGDEEWECHSVFEQGLRFFPFPGA